MGFLFVFAFFSGFVTIFAPCIWPILPLVLSSTITGGKRTPFGVTIGILLSFGLLTLLLSTIVSLLPFDTNWLRFIAAATIAIAGLGLLVPKFGAVIEVIISKVSSRFTFAQKKPSDSQGFLTGFLRGVSIGVLWTPCAGPILATIVSLAATKKLSVDLILVTFVYILGVGIPLFFFTLFSQKVLTTTRSLTPYTGRIQQFFGFVMVGMAFLVLTNYDKTLEAGLLNAIPGYSSFLTNIESNPLVTQALSTLRSQQSPTISLPKLAFLDDNTKAPDFVGITKWLNTDKPLSIADLKGKVVLVDFWTYTCINCIRTLPHVTNWYDKYKDKGFVVIGVHTPEFEFEKDTNNVLAAIQQYKIHYPVAQDNNYTTWNNFSNQYWPAEYLIDAKGVIRRTHFGEGEYDQTEQAIQQLLDDAGKTVSMPIDTLPDETPKGNVSPETYIGSNRMAFLYPDGHVGSGNRIFSKVPSLPLNTFSLSGEWMIDGEYSIAKTNARLTYHFVADKTYLVMRPGTSVKNTKVHILLDGKPIDAVHAGADVQNGSISVDSDRLYSLVDFHGKVEEHVLELEFDSGGIEVFAFTFG